MMLRDGLCLLLAALAVPAQAHRLDEYLQSATLRLAPDRVALHLRLVPGVEVAQQVWDSMDTDRNGDLSPAEQQAYARQVLGDLSLSIDGRDTGLEMLRWSFPTRAEIGKGVGQISLSLEARLVPGDGVHRLRLVTRHRPAISAYLVNTLLPVDRGIRITGQQRSADQTDYRVDFECHSACP
jgi:hypothetical protein